MDGWIKIYRKVLESPVSTNLNILGLFTYLLLKANFKDNIVMINLQTIEVKKGQMITSLKKLSQQFNVSRSTVSRMIGVLIMQQIVDIKTTNRYSVITILNYDKYQSLDTRWNTSEHQADTNKNDKNVKKRDTHTSMEYLQNIPVEDFSVLAKGLRVTAEEIKSKGEDLYNYCLSKGKQYRNYKAFLRNALKRDFKSLDDGYKTV